MTTLFAYRVIGNVVYRVGRDRGHDAGIVGNVVMMLGAKRAVLVPFRFPVSCPVPFRGILCEFAEEVEPLPYRC